MNILKTHNHTFKIILVGIWILTSYAITAQTKKRLIKEIDKRGEAYVLIKLPKGEKRRQLNNTVSIDRVKAPQGYAYAYVSTAKIDKFNTLNIEYTVETAPSLKLAATMCPDLTAVKNWNCYPTYSQYLDLMNEYAANYPELCRLDTIGTSVDGRLILSVKIHPIPDMVFN